MKKSPFLRSLGSGFTYGAVIGVFLFIVNTPADATFLEVLKLLLVAVICAVISGVILTLFVFLTDLIRDKKYDAVRTHIRKTEEIREEDRGARLLSGKSVRGMLFLTDQHLFFQSSDTSETPYCIAREHITSVEITDPRRCEITVVLQSMEVETFSMSDPRRWFDLLGSSQV